MFRGRMLATRVVAVLFAVALLGSCEYLHGAFARLRGQISITSDSLPMGSNEESYRAVLEAAGGAPPYKWVLQDGWLPAGNEVASGRRVDGNPRGAWRIFFYGAGERQFQPGRQRRQVTQAARLSPWSGHNYQPIRASLGARGHRLRGKVHGLGRNETVCLESAGPAARGLEAAT